MKEKGSGFLKRLKDKAIVLGKKSIWYCRRNPGFAVLLILLSWIGFSALKPAFYIVGWDNYSSYFNLLINIPRTLFSTWRAYRGFGVPSDSESTDLFRQLFDLVLTPILPTTLHDQVYMVATLMVGVLAMYFLARLLFTRYVSQTVGFAYRDVFSFFAAFFYLCNLHTLATFYFPMVMYTNRFFALPLLFYIFFSFLSKRTITMRHYLLSVVAIFFISGSYVTATILVTILLALFIVGLFVANKKKFLLIFIFYISLNLFWLLPFANYTLQKTQIIRLAPTFISANEAQLNKPKEFYGLQKQLTLYHNFFDTGFTTIVSGQKEYFHPITKWYTNLFYQAILWIFPVLYLLGCGLIVSRYKRNKQLLFIPVTIVVFLFLVLKEFSVLGFLYDFLNHLTPFFGVLFRFGDTKFHPFIAFAGSLAAAYAIVFLLQFGRRTHKLIVVLAVILLTLFVFREYVFGHLIGSFMYNRVPEAYFKVAQLINKDPQAVRVLHVPFDKEAYWKSYSWGAVGSSFFHFLLNKPLFDKTFEPASQENAYMHKRIGDLLVNAQVLVSEAEKKNRATEFAQLMQRTGVKYIVVDSTVGKNIFSRGITLWGDFRVPDVTAMVQSLKKYGFVRRSTFYPINLASYATTYEDSKLLSLEEKKLLMDNSKTGLELVELKKVDSPVSFLKEATYLDAEFDALLETPLLSSGKHFIQDKSFTAQVMYPFLRRNAQLSQTENAFAYSFEQMVSSTQLTVQVPATDSSTSTHYVDVYAAASDTELTINFYLRTTPTINGYTGLLPLKQVVVPVAALTTQNKQFATRDYISDWSTLTFDKIGPLRLQLGDYVLPLPALLSQDSSYVATVAVQGEDVGIAVMALAEQKIADLREFSLTDNPNCFYDNLKNFSFQQLTHNNGMHITSQNQSTCVLYPLHTMLEDKPAHAEIELQLSGNSQDLDADYGLSYDKTAKPTLKKAITALPKPNSVRVCVKEITTDDCYNLHQFVNVLGKTKAVFPLERPLAGSSNMSMLLSVKNTGYQRQTIDISSVVINTYNRVKEDSLSLLGAGEAYKTVINTQAHAPLSISFPKVLSSYAYYFNPQKEGLYGQNPNCDTEGGYRTFRLSGSALVTYVENCYIDMFAPAYFSSGNYYFWAFSYNLLSGKYPKFKVKDDLFFYTDEYISLHQGYPDIAGFKRFQAPEMWYQALFGYSTQSISQSIEDTSYQNAFGYLPPLPEVLDSGKKDITIHQDSENEGAMLIKNIVLQPLPQQWEHMSLQGGKVKALFGVPDAVSSKQLLPSLWKITGSKSPKGNQLLFFNEGYDSQWQLYDNWVGVITGIGGITPKKCDGYANCFVLDGEKSKQKVFYVFYTPERLTILGWIATGVAIIGFWRYFTRRKRAAVN